MNVAGVRPTNIVFFFSKIPNFANFNLTIFTERIPESSADIPNEIPYLLIGGGTASFAAFRAIKSHDPKAKVRHFVFLVSFLLSLFGIAIN